MRLRHQLVRCLCRAASAAYGQPTAAAPLTSKAALQLALLYKQPPCTPWHQLRLHHSAAAAEPTGSSKQRPQTLEEHEQACWSCKHHYQRGGLVCQSCDTIQPPDSSLNYFELLGCPTTTYDIDPAALERRYKLLQWQLHPDKTVQRTEEEKEFSAAQASLINQAYSVLRSPLARANYLLMLEGVPAGDNFEGTIEDPALLMEVMEAREAVEDTDDQEQLVALNRQFKQRQAQLVKQLSEAFRAHDLATAARLTAELTYWVRLEQATQQKL